MTTLVEDMQTLLTTLGCAGGSWYGINTTEPPVYPFTVFQRVASNPNVTLDGPSDLQNTRFQIDIFSLQISEAISLETALEAAMATWSVSNVPLSSQDQFEEAGKVYRIIKDYSVWSTN
jgi:hypothetical protein